MRNASYILILALYASSQQTPALKTGAAADQQEGARPTTVPKQDSLVTDTIASVIQKVLASPAARPKGEFETTEQYNARSIMTDNKVYVFVLPRVWGDFEYDADAQTMTANIFTNERTLEPKLRTVDLRQVLKVQNRYAGQSAFGVKMMISLRYYDVFGVAIAADSPIQLRDKDDLEGFWGCIGFKWRIGLDRTKSLKPYLRRVIAGRVAGPTVFEDTKEKSPTVTVSMKYEQKYLLFRLQEVRVVDERSGALVIKFTSNQVPE
jgi:hypothetical protein